MKLSLKISPHLKRVAVPLCEILIAESCGDQYAMGTVCLTQERLMDGRQQLL